MTQTSKTMLSCDLTGQLLIAMPGMPDGRFSRSVICMCAHSDEGAMGLIINRHAKDLNLGELLEQIDLEDDEEAFKLDPAKTQKPVHIGGPVESERGFVLHSPDYFIEDSTLQVSGGICLTATLDVLKAMGQGHGPRKSIVVLGYAGWASGQLEDELGANGWLSCAADPELVFSDNPQDKYERALAKLGVDPSHLVNAAGRA